MKPIHIGLLIASLLAASLSLGACGAAPASSAGDPTVQSAPSAESTPSLQAPSTPPAESTVPSTGTSPAESSDSPQASPSEDSMLPEPTAPEAAGPAVLTFDLPYRQVDDIDTIPEDYIPSLTLHADGTGVLFMNLLEDVFSLEIRYTVNGSILTVSANSNGALDYTGNREAYFSIDSATQLTFIGSNRNTAIGCTYLGDRLLCS